MTGLLIAGAVVWYSAVAYCIRGLIEAMEIGAQEMGLGPPISPHERNIVVCVWPLAAPAIGMMMYRLDRRRREGTP